MEWYFLGWVLVALFVLIIYWLLVIRALTHNPDFEIDDVDSGVFDARRYNKGDKHD